MQKGTASSPVALSLPLFKHIELLYKVLWMLKRFTVSLDSTEETWVDAGNTAKGGLKNSILPLVVHLMCILRAKCMGLII